MRAALIAMLAAAAGPVAAQDETLQAGRAGMQPMEEVVAVDAGTLAAFRDWIADFRDTALAEGISPATFDAAMAGVGYLPEAVAKDRNQAEFTRTVPQYLAAAVSEKRVSEGRAMLASHAALLDRIEAHFGVEREVVVAVWGMESSYGSNRGDFPVISSLATLAFDGRRAALFRSQLLAALRIIQTAEVAPADLRGSWAGAMGHTQFMPTSWLSLAVDFDGDGRRDIWGDDPTDALASTAAYLARSGWTRGQPWAVEVRLPEGFDFANSGKRDRRPVAEWASLGVTALAGDLPDHGPAALLLPAGAGGPALMVFGNFQAIEKYNAADAYVIAVGHLADRLAGGDSFVIPWPDEDRALTRAERVELQTLLSAAGFDPGGADGIVGPATIAALRSFQQTAGVAADGYAGLAALDLLRQGDPDR